MKYLWRIWYGVASTPNGYYDSLLRTARCQGLKVLKIRVDATETLLQVSVRSR